MILIFSITLPVILALNFLINFRSAHAILFVVVGVAVGLIGFFIIKKAKEGLIEKEKQEQDPICIEDHAEQGPGAEY